MTTRTALLAALLAGLAGCGACDTVPQEAIQDCSLQVTPGVAPTDVLFVIDDSSSMLNDQQRLRDGLYAFIQTLASGSAIQADYQFGVTTTSVVQWTDAQTAYVAGPSSGIPYAAGTIVAIQKDGTGAPLPGAFVYQSGAYGGPRILSSRSPSFQPDFEANVVVAENGSNREQPFRVARLALEEAGPGGTNEGFLRPGARLVVVFFSDEDDCSGPSDASIVDSAGCRAAKAGSLLTPVTDLATFLQGPVGGEVRDVVVGAIVGVAPGSACQRDAGGAWSCPLSCGRPDCANQACSTATDEGRRYVELLDHFATDHVTLASICDANFDDALAGLADVIMPDTLPLDGAPADYRMLVASLERPGVGTIPCGIELTGTPPAAAADAVYTPPQSGRSATLTFQNSCAIQHGDSVDVKVICAG